MLFVSWRVTGLDRSLGFYTAVGYAELGRTEAGDGLASCSSILPASPPCCRANASPRPW